MKTNNNDAELHQVQQLPVTPTEKGMEESNSESLKPRKKYALSDVQKQLPGLLELMIKRNWVEDICGDLNIEIDIEIKKPTNTEKKIEATLPTVQQRPVGPTAKGKKLENITPEDEQLLLDFGVNEAELYSEEELVEIGFIKRGIHGSDGQLHDS